MADKPAELHPNNPWPLLGVLGIFLVGVALVVEGDWRQGCYVLAGASALAGVARLVMPRSVAGLLVVRRRSLDVVAYLGFAVIIAVLTSVTPVTG